MRCTNCGHQISVAKCDQCKEMVDYCVCGSPSRPVIFLNWEGRNYSTERFIADITFINNELSKPFWATVYDVGVLFTNRHPNKLISCTHYLCGGSMSGCPDRINKSDVEEWKEFKSVLDWVKWAVDKDLIAKDFYETVQQAFTVKS